MGMFDTVKVDLNRLPIEEKDRKKIGINTFQTKDFDCVLTEISLGERLMIKRSDIEEVPMNERPYPNAGGLREFIGSLREINIRWEDLNFHGKFNFYARIGGKKPEFFNFEAKYTDGNLTEIKRIYE